MNQRDDVLRRTTLALLQLGDVSAAEALAEQLVRRFETLDETGQLTYFHFLLDELGADRQRLDKAIDTYRESPGELEVVALAEAAASLRQPLFRALNTAPHGISTLLLMRTALLGFHDSHPELRAVESDLEHLLRSWFNRGFLELRRLDWSTPAEILEKIIEYEAVHEIRGWDDLRRRLEPDRRCFGYFHPSLPDEPIIFVEVALTVGMASSIHDVIDAPTSLLTPSIDTAIFYSITNCQDGLRGISFGSFLIKRVTTDLAAELPQLRSFGTLSPLPGFAAWVDTEHPDLDTTDESEVTRAAAHYLLCARRDGLPVDSVARFHLRNGARIERINWEGDTSEKGQRESYGVLVNYLYSGQDLAANHDALIQDGLVIAAPEIIGLAGPVATSTLCATSPPDGNDPA